MDNESKSPAVWPDFSTLESQIFPDWLKKSVIELVTAYPDKLERVGIEFWFTSHYNDNNNVEEHADAFLVWKNHEDRPSEDELDYIPGMRRMSRKASELVNVLGVESDNDGSMLYEVNFYIDRNGVLFSATEHSEEDGIYFECKPDGDAWSCHAIFKTYVDELTHHGVSETALITDDKNFILEDLNPEIANLEEWPEIKEYKRDEDGNVELIFDLDEFIKKRKS